MSTGSPVDRLPNDALVMVGEFPDDDAEAVTPRRPAVAIASMTATLTRATLPRILVLVAAVVCMDPPFRCPSGPGLLVSDLGPVGARRGAALHRVEHLLDLEPVGERRDRVVAVGDRMEQVAHLVGEGVLVADGVAVRPPRPGVRVAGPGDLDPPEPLGHRVVARLEQAQLVQGAQLPDDAAQLAVDLHRQPLGVAAGEAGGLEAPQRPAGEAG